MLKDKVAVVTGGTRGIGYAIVKKYLENGAKVVLFGSRAETVGKALASLKAENPDWVVEGAYPNLMDEEAVAKAIQDVKEKYGKIDILVNNAGVSDSTKVDNYEDGQFEKVIKLNVNAIFNAVRPRRNIPKNMSCSLFLFTILRIFYPSRILKLCSVRLRKNISTKRAPRISLPSTRKSVPWKSLRWNLCKKR